MYIFRLMLDKVKLLDDLEKLFANIAQRSKHSFLKSTQTRADTMDQLLGSFLHPLTCNLSHFRSVYRLSN